MSAENSGQKFFGKEKQHVSSPYRDENVLPFRQPELNQWVATSIQAELAGKSEKTQDAYRRILR